MGRAQVDISMALIEDLPTFVINFIFLLDVLGGDEGMSDSDISLFAFSAILSV